MAGITNKRTKQAILGGCHGKVGPQGSSPIPKSVEGTCSLRRWNLSWSACKPRTFAYRARQGPPYPNCKALCCPSPVIAGAGRAKRRCSLLHQGKGRRRPSATTRLVHASPQRLPLHLVGKR